MFSVILQLPGQAYILELHSAQRERGWERDEADQHPVRAAATTTHTHTQPCFLAVDQMPVFSLSVPTSLAGSILTAKVGTFSRQLAVAGLK